MHWNVRGNWLDMNENSVDKAHFGVGASALSVNGLVELPLGDRGSVLHLLQRQRDLLIRKSTLPHGLIFPS